MWFVRRTRKGRGSSLALAALLVALVPGQVLGVEPPPNDDPTTATVVAALPFADSLDIAEANGGELPSLCGGFASRTVFYRFEPAANERIVISTAGSDFDSAVDLWAIEEHGYAPAGCDNDGGPGQTSRLVASLAGGTPYLIAVSWLAAEGEDRHHLQLAIDRVPPPANDDIADATPVTSIPFVDATDTATGSRETADPAPSCGSGGAGPTIWYALQLPADATIVVDTAGSQMDTRLSLWSGTPGSLAEVACADNTPQGSWQARLRANVSGGEQLYVLLDWAGGQYPEGGTVVVAIDAAAPPPANDTLAGAIDLSPLPFSTTIDTSSATTDADDLVSPCFGEPYGATVWFTWTAPNSNPIVLGGGADYTAFADIYVATPDGLAWDRCFFIGSGSTRLEPVAGTTYVILVGSTYGGGGGTLTVTATEAFRASLSVDRTARLNARTGVVTITGTVTCSQPAFISTSFGELTQKVGRYTIRGQVSLSTFCDGSTRFEIPVSGDAGPFTAGQADVDLLIFAFSSSTGESDQPRVTRTLTLKGSR